MVYYKKIILFILLLSGIVVYAQNKPDSLEMSQQNIMFTKYLKLSNDEQFNLEERKLFSLKAIELATKLKQPKAIMEALSSNGYILAQQGHYAQAFVLFSEVIQMSDSVGYISLIDWRRKAYLSNIMGLIYKELGEYDKALSQYYSSLSICDSVGWAEGISTALNNISVLYDLNGNTKQAISILNDSKKIAETNGFDKLLFDIYINQMEMFIKTQSFDSSLFSGKNALELAIKLNIPYYQAFVEIGFGKLYGEEGKYKQAIASLNRCVELTLKHGFDEIQLQALIELAKTYRYMQKIDKADSIIMIALPIDMSIKIPMLQVKLLMEQSKLREITGDYKKSFAYYKRAIFLKDSINNSWEKVKYAEINTLYHIKFEKERNMILEKNLSLKQLQVKEQRLFIIISMGFLLILIGLVILLYRKRRFEMKTNQILRKQNEKISSQQKIIRMKNEQNFKIELDYKNRQLTAFSLSTLKQSESLSIIFKQINELLHQQNIKSSTRSKLERIIHYLRPLNTQKEWEEFRSYFEAVHPSFYTNLKKAAPDLTLNEQKICAHLRLGMNTKEIASITFRQVRSVESTRFRIRKKFGLTANDNLFEFLEKL